MVLGSLLRRLVVPSSFVLRPRNCWWLLLLETVRADIATELLAQYSLDGDVLDRSGNAYDCTASGITYSSGAAQFDGAAYVMCPTALCVTGTNPRTYCMWAQPTFDGGRIFSYGSNDACNKFSLRATPTAGDFRLNMGSSCNVDATMGTDGVWSHFCVIYDGTTMFMYEDASLITSEAASPTSSVTDFYFGRAVADNAYFTGAIKDAYVFTRALTAADVIELFQLGPTPVPSRAPSFKPSEPPPSSAPSFKPTDPPSGAPSSGPSSRPSQSPSESPSSVPSSRPSLSPSEAPTPSEPQSETPSEVPSSLPSFPPTHGPTENPSEAPSNTLSSEPSDAPSVAPSTVLSSDPSDAPSDAPSAAPSEAPSSSLATSEPSEAPSAIGPSICPSSVPTAVRRPTTVPTIERTKPYQACVHALTHYNYSHADIVSQCSMLS